MTTGRSYLTLNDVRLFPKIPNTLALVLIFSEADARMSRDTHVSFLTLSNLRLSTSSALVFVYDHFGVVFYFFLIFLSSSCSSVTCYINFRQFIPIRTASEMEFIPAELAGKRQAPSRTHSPVNHRALNR